MPRRARTMRRSNPDGCSLAPTPGFALNPSRMSRFTAPRTPGNQRDPLHRLSSGILFLPYHPAARPFGAIRDAGGREVQHHHHERQLYGIPCSARCSERDHPSDLRRQRTIAARPPFSQADRPSFDMPPQSARFRQGRLQGSLSAAACPGRRRTPARQASAQFPSS